MMITMYLSNKSEGKYTEKHNETCSGGTDSQSKDLDQIKAYRGRGSSVRAADGLLPDFISRMPT